MRRFVCLVIAFALALQAGGFAYAIPLPCLGEVRGLKSFTPADRMIECSAGILPAPDHDDADRMIEMVDGTGTTEWTYVDADLTQLISPQGTFNIWVGERLTQLLNAGWIAASIIRGKKIIDVGFDGGRAVPSAFYKLEKQVIEWFNKPR